MKYGRLGGVYDRLDATPSTLEGTEFPADAFDDAGGPSWLTARAIADAAGAGDERSGSWWRETNDRGEAAGVAERRRRGGDGR